MSQNRRFRIVSTHVSPAELERIHSAARKAGMSRAAFVRQGIHAAVQRVERQVGRRRGT
jgi:hypothetical protein